MNKGYIQQADAPVTLFEDPTNLFVATFLGSPQMNIIESSLIEEKGEVDKCNWYYINSLLFLAKSYEDNKQFDKANQVYDKILRLRPDYEAIHRWKH